MTAPTTAKMRARVSALLLGLAVGVTGCATVVDSTLEGTTAAPSPSLLSNCCLRVEILPAPIVQAMEKRAEDVIPCIRNIQFRDSYLSRFPAAQARVLDAAEPLDVLFFSLGAELSGRMVAGYLNHTAVYLGDERDLRALGLWDHPDIRPHHDAIQAGAVVVEANENEVRLVGPDVFFDTDSVAIFAPGGISVADQRAGVLALIDALGTPFDFHFDMDTDDALFCVELLQVALPDLTLPEREIFGRTSVIPDELAAEALRGENSLVFRGFVYGGRRQWGIGSSTLLAQTIARAWP